MRRLGFRTLEQTARAIFPTTGRVVHAAINHSDAAILKRHFGNKAFWLPNLAEPPLLPPTKRIRATHSWLRAGLVPDDAPVWLLPCRSLRRKNLAEALLLTRWLRPEAWLVVTGAASSADELPYVRALECAANQHHWRMRAKDKPGCWLAILPSDTAPGLMRSRHHASLSRVPVGVPSHGDRFAESLPGMPQRFSQRPGGLG